MAARRCVGMAVSHALHDVSAQREHRLARGGASAPCRTWRGAAAARRAPCASRFSARLGDLAARSRRGRRRCDARAPRLPPPPPRPAAAPGRPPGGASRSTRPCTCAASRSLSSTMRLVCSSCVMAAVASRGARHALVLALAALHRAAGASRCGRALHGWRASSASTAFCARSRAPARPCRVPSPARRAWARATRAAPRARRSRGRRAGRRGARSRLGAWRGDAER